MSFKSSSAEEIKKQIKPILKKHSVARAAIFGSFARGEQTKFSDVDLMVEFKGKRSLLDLIGLQQSLEDAIGVKFDVTTFKYLHPLIKKQAIKDQQFIL